MYYGSIPNRGSGSFSPSVIPAARRTIQGQHHGMAAFDVRRGAVQPRATESGTEVQNVALNAATGDSVPSETSEKHQMH
jgi:hypothetical protein